jgi:hypothetical protein
MANTTTCPTKFAESVSTMFFDEHCVADMPKDTFLCPLETVDLFVKEFLGGLRFESGVLTLIGMLALVMLMQLGGIPTARGTTGTFLWCIYTSTIVGHIVERRGSPPSEYNTHFVGCGAPSTRRGGVA